MPPYQTKDLDGKPFDLAAKKGRVVLLNVWATWCGPCVFEIPHLNAVHEKYAARGLEVVGVSVDDSGSDGVKRFAAERKMSYPLAIDPDGHIASLLNTETIPTSVLIGRDGKIVWRATRPVIESDDAGLAPAIEKALAAR